MKVWSRALTVPFFVFCFQFIIVFRHFSKYKLHDKYKLEQLHFDTVLSSEKRPSSQQSVLYFNTHFRNLTRTTCNANLGYKLILFYNTPEFMRIKGKKDAIYNDCECRNCIISQNRSKLMIADAVIFYIGIRNERMGEYPPINASNRNPNQAWIFTSVEPPEHYYNSDYMSPLWQSTMNWSCLYRLDSDIPNPYGFLIPSSEVDMLDYNSIYDKKTRNALWIVSHCQVASARRQFVLEMIRNGFNVDIFGGCSANGRQIDTRELKQIIPLYKFVLAFENSLCIDYISEKYFNNYNSSWIIVVRGGADYNRLLPKDTYINTADFKDISTLVSFLSKLGNDRLRYIHYLKIKSEYVSIRWPGNKHCELCRRLNNLKQYRKSYADLNSYLNNQCYRPYDLDW